MQDHSTQNSFDPRSLSALFDWKPDLERLEREVAHAELKGTGDGLCLAEMECSLDLIDAELASLCKRPQDREAQESIGRLVEIREKLVNLIVRMRPLAQY